MIFKKLLSSDPKIQEDPEGPRPDYEPSWGYRTLSGERISVEASKSIATVYAAKNIISNDVAKMPLQQLRQSGRNTVQVEPNGQTRNMAYLLQVSPNMWGWTPFIFKKMVIEWQLFYGNAYIWAPAVGPRQLLILPADRTMPVLDLDGGVWYRTIFANNIAVYLPGVEVLHLMINPDISGFLGRSVLTYARETFGRQIAARKTQAKFFSNGFMPAAYVQIPGELSAEARKKVRLAYEEQMSGAENAYRLAVFDQLITKFEPINIQLKDAQFLESIDANDRDICNFFGLPEFKLNRGKQAYSSNEQNNLDYLEGTLNAYLIAWEEGARIFWLPVAEHGNSYFKFVRDSLLQMDNKTRGEAMATRIQNGIMTPNEAREKEDLSAYPEGDQYYMAGNILPIGDRDAGIPTPGAE
jgi:HK97 family phage portal protein